MRPARLILDTAGATPWYRVDRYRFPFQLSLAVALQGAALTYSVEHIYVDPDEDPSGDAIFTKASGKTAASETFYTAPVVAVRVNVTAYTSGAGVAYLVQA